MKSFRGILSFCLAMFFAATAVRAQRIPMSYDLGVTVDGGYNRSTGGYGGAGLKGTVAVGNYLDIKYKGDCLMSRGGRLDVWAAGLDVQPKINIGKGAIYFEGCILYRQMVIDRSFDFSMGAGLGYRRPHFDIMAGLYSRTMGATDRQWSSLEVPVSEPFNLMYRAQFFVMGPDSRWDIFGGVGNIREYQVERQFDPCFFAGGRFDLDEHVRFNAQVDVIQSGMFHLNAVYFGTEFRAGVTYIF